MPQIIPSIMANSQRELNQLMRKVEKITSIVHLDIADGTFVPTTMLQFPLKLLSSFNYQAHLMIKTPLPFIKRNLHRISLFIPQFEVFEFPQEYIDFMREKKLKVAFALHPETSVDRIKHFLQQIDFILILTVRPGYYGAKFLPKPLRKIKQIKKINPKITVIVDGGMNPTTIQKARRAGADVFISGSYVMTADDARTAMRELERSLKK